MPCLVPKSTLSQAICLSLPAPLGAVTVPVRLVALCLNKRVTGRCQVRPRGGAACVRGRRTFAHGITAGSEERVPKARVHRSDRGERAVCS